MATIAVKLVLQKLTFLLEEEAQLLVGVGKGIKLLQGDLESMKSFLEVAEARSETDKSIKTWVKQVREVAYDAEDVLEEFLVRLKLPPGRGFSHSLRNFFHYIQHLGSRHRLANQIQSIRANIRAISERKNAFSFNQTDGALTSNSNLQSWHDPRVASLYMREADVVGIEKPKSLLISWLTEGELDLTAISVVGMGGIGKTTLVKKVFDSQPVRKFFDCHAWVTVSKSFKVMELLQAALKGFLEATKEPAPEGISTMGESILVETLRNYLQQRRYVIVFDDIWSINAWESVKYALPDSKCGSRIVFTTRLTDIASSVETNPHIYSLQPLPEEEAWNLFSMKSLQGKQQLGVCPAELEELSYSILKKCGGLPLAIVVIGGLLSKKERTVFEWKKVYDSLAAEMKNDHSLESLGRILMISYNDLPYYLKLCYLYLSVFPEDYIIKRTKLTRLWLAERIVDEKQGLSMEEAAEQYIYELVSRSLIQVVEIDDFNKIRSCRVHDVMREILQLKSQEESLVTSVNGSSIILNEKIRRKSIHQNYDDFPLSMRFQGLRSLLLFKSGNSSRSSDNPFFNGFRLLRVLELELAPISQFPKELIALIHLRYLSLRRTMIRELPESIWKLKSLETLDLKSTLVSAMPVGILKLKNLHRLQCYRYHFHTSSFFADTYGMKVPSGIGCMTSLQKLGTVEVNEGIATELGKLSQLKKLGVVKLRKEDAGNLSSSLEKMRHLNSFYMVSINKNESIQLDSLSSPPQFLQHLYLKCPLVALPGWIASLQHLAKLVLQDSNLNVDLLKAFQNLPHLVILELRSAYTGEELCCDAVGYPRLKKLGLYQLEQLKHLRVAQGAMPGLKALDLTSCGVLEGVPLGIEHLNNLQELMLWDMPYRFLRQIQTPDESWKVQHISTIKIVYHAGGRWVVHNLN